MYVEASWIRPVAGWPVNPADFEYGCDWQAPYELPDWLTDRQEYKTVETYDFVWDILSEHILAKRPKNEVIRCSYGLWLFNSATGSACSSQLSPVKPRVYRAMEEIARNKNAWPLEWIWPEVFELRNELQLWLPQLPKDTIGVWRLYDWGKY